jgi:hypothetical protein
MRIREDLMIMMMMIVRGNVCSYIDNRKGDVGYIW